MSISAQYTTTRLELQRVITHTLARARFDADGRFGLRVTPSGLGTPAFGPDGDVIRIAGDALIREFRNDGTARSATVELAAFAAVDLAKPFSAGTDTPDLGDVDAPIALDADAAETLTDWLRVGSLALDRVLPTTHEPSVAQVWPEHFDIGLDVATGHGRVNLGASPGDNDYPEPYLYVSPWEGSPPGDTTFWNAPFGAVMSGGDGKSVAEHVRDAVTFFETALGLLGRG